MGPFSFYSGPIFRTDLLTGSHKRYLPCEYGWIWTKLSTERLQCANEIKRDVHAIATHYYQQAPFFDIKLGSLKQIWLSNQHKFLEYCSHLITRVFNDYNESGLILKYVVYTTYFNHVFHLILFIYFVYFYATNNAKQLLNRMQTIRSDMRLKDIVINKETSVVNYHGFMPDSRKQKPHQS